jgi:hypothetical protein
MSNKPVGGRGKKAPYSTTILRVPDPLVEQFQKDIDSYREAIINGTIDEQIPVTSIKRNSPLTINKEDIIKFAQGILKQKKSARVSLTKLLQVLYDDYSIKL